MKIAFLDLHKQYETIKSEIDAAISSVMADAAFVGGKFRLTQHPFISVTL